MCTAVILADGPDGFVLAVNRDELRSRAKALPPEVRHEHGLAIAAPRDAEAHGTWVAVNAAGLALTLLNSYQPPARPVRRPLRSRGRVADRLARSRSLDELVQTARELARAELAFCRPFEVAAVAVDAPHGPARAVRLGWDGAQLTVAPLDLPAVLTSAILDPEGTQRARRAELPELLQAMVLDGPARAQAVRHWFARHDLGQGPRAVCMHRLLAQTVSHTLIEVGPRAAVLRYHADAPCRDASEVVVRLERAPA